MRLTKALFETIVGTLLALYALGTDAHMNGSGTDAAQACPQRYRWHLEKNATQMPAISGSLPRVWIRIQNRVAG